MLTLLPDVKHPKLSLGKPPEGALLGRVDRDTQEIVLFRGEKSEEDSIIYWQEIGRLSIEGHTIT